MSIDLADAVILALDEVQTVLYTWFPRGGVMECSRQIATTKPKDVTSDDVGHAHRWTARMLESSRKATAYAPVNRRRFSSGSRDLI